MDALAEILKVIRLDSAIYFNAELSEPWCLSSPEASVLAPILARTGEHVIVYHLLCEGRAYVQLEDGVEASCRVRALAEDKTAVGELAFTPVDGVNEVVIRTERRATSVEKLGCTSPDQPRPR